MGDRRIDRPSLADDHRPAGRDHRRTRFRGQMERWWLPSRPQQQDMAKPWGTAVAQLGQPHPNDPYDRNGDGIFNIKDYCPNPQDELDCGGSGDSRVRGAAGSPDTDYNANGWIDPEDLIFKFSDGVDQDGNGYKDDFVGWDAYEDDNDPFDEVQYGHGTGEARDSTAEVNNDGDAGVCPNCMVMHIRAGDSFVADVNDFAEGVIYATDNGARLIPPALRPLHTSRLAPHPTNHAD